LFAPKKEKIMKKEFKLTKDGVAELQSELAELKAKLIEVIDAIKTARDQGDLSENAEYHAAKEEQERVDGRISEVEHILANAEVISKASNSKIGIGNGVTLKGGRKEVTYHIVDSVEADPLEAKISDESPIGKALIGKKLGDKVEIELPAGKTIYEVVSIA
jgi:transcription elongation factor GreA